MNAPAAGVVPPPVPTRPAPPSRASWVTWAGLAVVLIAAAVLSFAALRDLAVSVRISDRLAWLMPIAVDAGAAVSCSAWLSPRSPRDVARFARSLTWALLVLTVVGNAAAQGMAAAGITPPWWCAVLVGAIPPAVVGGVVHLAVLVGRGSGAEPVIVTTTSTTVEAEPGEGVETAPTPLESRVRALVATADGPVGRKTVMREFGVTEHQARKVLSTVATNGREVRA